MPTLNVTTDAQKLSEINPAKAFEALALVTLDAINVLREKAGLADITPGQMKQALISKYKSL